MKFIEEIEKPYECLKMKIEDFMQGKLIELNMEEPLDLTEDLYPKIQIQLVKENESLRVLQVYFSTYHENFCDIAGAAQSMVKINRLIRFAHIPEKGSLRADLVEDYFVIQYEEQISNNKESEPDESYWREKLNHIINLLMFLVIGNEV